MHISQQLQFIVTIYKYEVTATILITNNFANMKGTIYGNRLARSKQVEKKLGTTEVEHGNMYNRQY